jgi:hypothetical protein
MVILSFSFNLGLCFYDRLDSRLQGMAVDNVMSALWHNTGDFTATGLTLA